MTSKISYFRHALYIVIAYIGCLTCSNLIYYLHTNGTETGLIAQGSVIVSAPFLLASLLVLPFVRGSLERHTRTWCLVIIFFMTIIFLSICAYNNLGIAGLYIPIFVFSSASMASLIYYIFVKTRLERANLKSTSRLLMAALAFCFLFPCVGYSKLENSLQLQHTPREFDVSKVIYSEEKAWGFGPGGNETGVVVYELPEDIGQKIIRDKLTYLNNLPSKGYGGRNWQGRYPEWSETPLIINNDRIDASSEDLGPVSDKPPYEYRISDYLNKYGFSIDLDEQVEGMIDDAMSKPGSFYAYGRIGLIIVMPDNGKIVYAYNG